MKRFLIVMLLAGCTEAAAPPPAEQIVLPILPELPEGYPPKIGSVSARLDGVARAWDTYDYSIGAYDASVQIVTYDGVQFRLMGEAPGKPQSDVDRLVIGADMTSLSQTGALAAPVIEIVAGKDWDGPRLTSVGSEAEVVIETLRQMGPQGSYGNVTGRFSAVLCAATGKPARVDKTACQPFEGTFASDLQIGGP